MKYSVDFRRYGFYNNTPVWWQNFNEYLRENGGWTNEFQNTELEKFNCKWVDNHFTTIEFEHEEDATAFILRWS